MLVSIAASGLGSGKHLRSELRGLGPRPLSTTSPVKHTVTQGDLTQEAFYTSSSEDPAIRSPSSPSRRATACRSTSAPARSPSPNRGEHGLPFDTPSAASASGTGTTLSPAALTTAAGDELVGLYASDASNLALTGSTILAPVTACRRAAARRTRLPARARTARARRRRYSTPRTGQPRRRAQSALEHRNRRAAAGPTAADDFIVATVTANGLSTGNICAPNDGTWTELNDAPVTSTNGGVTTTQATYYGSRFGDSPESYLFTFQTNCSATGTAVPASATAVAAALRRRQPDHAHRHRRLGEPDLQQQHGRGHDRESKPCDSKPHR